jgi:universal stress protein A
VSIAVAETAMDDLMMQWQQQLDLLAAARASKAPFAPTILRIGDPANVILELANELHAELVVMGTHGRRGVSRLLLGSVAESVARSSPCPVLLLREGAGSA